MLFSRFIYLFIAYGMTFLEQALRFSVYSFLTVTIHLHKFIYIKKPESFNECEPLYGFIAPGVCLD